MKLQKDDFLSLKKGDFIIIAAVLLIAGIAVLLIMRQNLGGYVKITSFSDTSTYPINEDRNIEIIGDNGGHNLVVISDGKVWVKEADCKNRICVNHKPVYKNHESIVCLPNHLVVEVVSYIPNEIDN